MLFIKSFSSIVNSLVNDLIMPVIGVIIGGINFTGLTLTVGKATIYYGNFLQNVINFLIIAFAIFMLVKLINKFFKKKEEVTYQLVPFEKVANHIRHMPRNYMNERGNFVSQKGEEYFKTFIDDSLKIDIPEEFR